MKWPEHIAMVCLGAGVGLAGPALADDVIWDYGPETGEYARCSTNISESYNLADDVIFSEFMELTGIDIWTCIEAPEGDMHVKIVFDNGYVEPGEDYLRWDMEHSRFEFEGNYNGTDLYKVSFDFDPVLLRADTRYWIGVSGNGWDLRHALVEDPGNDWWAGFIGRDFDRMYYRWGDLMFQLRGRPVFPPFELALEGECPSQVTASVIGATPGGKVAFIGGRCAGGETTIDRGACAGTIVPLGTARLIATATADLEGNAQITGQAPGGLCGAACLVAVDLSTCAVSEVARTYARPELYVEPRIEVTKGFVDFNISLCCNKTVPSCYEEGGLLFRRVHDGCSLRIGSLKYCGGDGTPALYTGGQDDMLGITLVDGTDFDAIEFNAGDGYVRGSCPFTYLWVRAYLDGVAIADYAIDLPRWQVMGLRGGKFDELRIGAYYNALNRDKVLETGNERAHQTIAIDNVRFGAVRSLLFAGPESPRYGEFNTFTVSNATPRQEVWLLTALATGIGPPIPGCPGLNVDLVRPRIVKSQSADAVGVVEFRVFIPDRVAGWRTFEQAVERATCRTSNVVQTRWQQ